MLGRAPQSHMVLCAIQVVSLAASAMSGKNSYSKLPIQMNEEQSSIVKDVYTHKSSYFIG